MGYCVSRGEANVCTLHGDDILHSPQGSPSQRPIHPFHGERLQSPTVRRLF